jgi:hypothetical protein
MTVTTPRKKLTRRTPEEVETFKSLVLSAIPTETDARIGIREIGIKLGMLKTGRKWPRRSVQRRLNEALAGLVRDGKIERVGQSKASAYRRL